MVTSINKMGKVGKKQWVKHDAVNGMMYSGHQMCFLDEE